MEDINIFQDERKEISDGRSTLLMEESPTNKVLGFKVTKNLVKILSFKKWYDPYKHGSRENLINRSSTRE
jgi:hypothetical protein